MATSSKATQEQPGIIAGLLAFVGCAVVSCIAWYPLGGPAYGMTFAFRSIGCGNVVPGSTQMFFCSAGVALLQMLPAVIILAVILVFRKPLMRWVQQAITPRLPQGMQFLVAPVVATCLFVIVWAGVHYTLATQTGLLPQIIFPAVVGLFTFITVRYGDGLRRALDPFFQSRDRFPRWLCFVGIFAIPLLLSVLITQPWRQIVSAGPQLEHFIVLVALVVAFLLLTPRLGELAPVAVGSGGRGGVPVRGGKGGMMRLVMRGAGYAVCRLVVAVGMAAALHAVLDLWFAEVALAHDCTPDRPWDCQNTGGFNTTTATGSGVLGAGAAATGATIASGGGGKAGGEGEAAGADGSSLDGGPDDNPFTEFDGGEGPGKCEPEVGLPNYWVNTATLSLVVQDTVFAYRGLGPALAFRLTFNSGSQNRGMFGRGWAFSYESWIERSGKDLFLRKGSGQRVSYTSGSRAEVGSAHEPVEAVSVEGSHDRLLDYGDHWLFVENNSRLTYRYERSPGGKRMRLTEIVDIDGNTVRVNYAPGGSIEVITDAAGRSTRLMYDEEGRCISLTLPDGRTAAFSYDSQGNLARTQDLLGIPSVFGYDAEHHMTRMVVGHDRRTTTFGYENTGRRKHVSVVTNAAGNATRYDVASVNPRQTRVTDPEGNVTLYYSTEGRTERVVDPLGNSTLYGYAGGLRSSIRNKNGRTIRIEYDMRGNVSRLVDPLGNSLSWTYDTDGNVVCETSPLGETIRYTYDARNKPIEATYSTGKRISREYNRTGQLAAIVDERGNRTVFTYDIFGNLAAVTDPLGRTVRMSYDQYGMNLRATTDARGNTTEYEYDENNRLTKVVHPDGSTFVHSYDCCAEVAITDENGNQQTFSRNPMMAITEWVDGMGNTMTIGGDRNNRLVNVVDALGRVTRPAYDAAGRVTWLTNARGDVIRMAYDPAGNLISLWDEKGRQTTFDYDHNNNPIAVTDPLGQRINWSTNALGRLSAIVNSRGQKIAFTCDASGRIVEKLYDGVQVAAYEYDASGNLIKMTDATGVTSYTYDAANQVTVVKYPGGLQASFSYDEAGNISAITYPDDLVVRYTYDSRNRLTGVTWGENSISYHHDGVGNVVAEARSNGTESTYAYDANNRFAEIEHRKGAEAFAQMTYTRDAVGNITSASGVLPLEPSLSTQAVPTTYNDVNQIVTRGSDTYTYDADGNLTEVSGGQWRAAYDPENRIVQLDRGGQTTRYVYDGLRRRTKVVAGSRCRNLCYDSMGRLLFETDAGGQMVACYIYGAGLLVARVNTARETHFYHCDKTGNVLALTDASGQVVAAYAYSPFGEVVSKLGFVGENPFTYTGEYGVMDEGDGLFFMKHRCYDAMTGRFLQKDPIGFGGGINLYAYANNNPITTIDPEGTIGIVEGALVVTLLICTLWGAKKVAEEGYLEPVFNPINKILQDPTKGSEVAQELGDDPGTRAKQKIIAGQGKILTEVAGNNPYTGPAVTAGKTAYHLHQGKPVDAAKEVAGSLDKKVNVGIKAADYLSSGNK